VIVSLAGRVPEADPVALLGNFIPPPLFAAVSFESYQPDAQYPSQAAALAFARVFAQRSTTRPRKRLFRAPPPEDRPGLYLDGGFGVGKTHLLASIYRAWQGRKLFGTFVEYTNLVGLLGFAECVRLLSEYSLICIDEFELDDPGDTVLMSSLLAELVGAGVKLAATSNTLPDRLGEGRFAAEDFLREIQGLRAHFDVVRIDGEDYRHRGLPVAPSPAGPEVLRLWEEAPGTTAVVPADELLQILASIHPSRYGTLIEGLDRVVLPDLPQLQDQADALRLVVLVDRLYDRQIPVLAGGVPVDEVFAADMLTGGYRKKYFRAVSRLVALARLQDGV